MINAVILGAGNVATHLYHALNSANDVDVIQWYNRDIAKLQQYKNEVSITSVLSDLKEADIYLLALSDDAIGPFSDEFPFTNRFIVHTSGAMSLHVLNKKNRRGVFCDAG